MWAAVLSWVGSQGPCPAVVTCPLRCCSGSSLGIRDPLHLSFLRLSLSPASRAPGQSSGYKNKFFRNFAPAAPQFPVIRVMLELRGNSQGKYKGRPPHRTRTLLGTQASLFLLGVSDIQNFLLGFCVCSAVMSQCHSVVRSPWLGELREEKQNQTKARHGFSPYTLV